MQFSQENMNTSQKKAYATNTSADLAIYLVILIQTLMHAQTVITKLSFPPPHIEGLSTRARYVGHTPW